MDISKLKKSLEKKREKTFEKIEEELKKMDFDYFLKLSRKIIRTWNEIQKNKTTETESAYDEAVFKFEKERARYYGYEQIIKNPEKEKEITREIEKKIKELEVFIKTSREFSKAKEINEKSPFESTEQIKIGG